MKNQRKAEIKVGIMTIVGTLLFLWILGWAKNFSFSSNERQIKVRFNNVSGLNLGDYVTVNGVREGNVNDIEIENGKVLVSLSVKNKIKLEKDASFSISMIDLMGGKKVEVSPGTSNVPLDYNKIQTGKFSADIPTVMALVGSMQTDITSSIKDIRITLTSLNKYLTDKKLNSDIKNSMNGLNLVLEKLNRIIDENHSNINKLTKNSADLTKQAKLFMSKNNKNLTSSIKELNKVLGNTDTLLTRVNSFVKETENRKNNLGKALYDKNLSANLIQTVTRLNKITKLILKQLQNEGMKVDAHIKLF